MSSPEKRLVTLLVDGHRVEAEVGQLLIHVLRDLGIQVPTLCHDDRLTPYGGCRLCVVGRRDGREGLVVSCSTPVQQGMIIETEGPEITESRRRQLQLMVLNHRMECPTCERSGDCRFQDLIYDIGVPDDPLPFELLELSRDEDSPVIIRDPEKCIICGRCVRLCDEVQGVGAIGLVDRGLDVRVTTFLDRPLDCEFCGQCVNACPVGALIARPYVSHVPVWLRTSTTTTCSYCSCGCQVTMEHHEGSVRRVTANEGTEPNRGKLCVKGWIGWDVLAHPDRLTRPLVRSNGKLRPVSWEHALTAAADGLATARDDGRAVVGIGSARLSCEDAYLMQRFVRCSLGSPHVDVGPVGGVHAIVEGAGGVLGIPAPSAGIDDLRKADLVVVLRGDPSRTHPLVKTEIVQSVRQRGNRLAMAATLTGGLECHADLFLDVEPGTEQVLLHGLAASFLERAEPGPECVEGDGFDGWRKSVRAYTRDVVSEITGVGKDQVDALTAMMLEAERCVVVIVTGLGIPGDEAAVVRAAAQALEVRGRVGGVMILGEKTNVQGVVDVGLVAGHLPGHRDVEDEDHRRLVGDLWGETLCPGRGWDAAEAFARAAAGEVGALYLVGQDPVSCWPRLYGAREAIAGAGFVVVQDAFLTDTARLADVVFPVAILTERAGSVVGLDGRRRELHRSVEPPEHLPQDGHVMVELARRLGKAVPSGDVFEQEISRLVSWPSRGGRVQHWQPVPEPVPPARWSGFLLDTSPQLFHSGSVTFHSHQLQALSPTVAVRLNPDDAAEIGVHSGEVVAVEAGGRERLLRARIDRTVGRGKIVVPWQGGPDGGAVLMERAAEPMAVRVRRSH